jgi:uncharacterized protein YbaR (Trm112 family)/SAM-dependent methyltransferase
MHRDLLTLLRCPFCGTSLSIVENEALSVAGDHIESGVIGCECCAFPIVAGIPVMCADDPTRDAMHLLEGGRREEAFFMLLGLDRERGDAFRRLLASPDATYRAALEILSTDAEGTYFVYRFSDPTFISAEAVLRAVAQQPGTVSGRLLDLCGGTGHLSRVLTGLSGGGHEVVLADLFFWKLWLAKRFTAPACSPVCCDANNPLPFDRNTFSLVVLPDAFPYIWQKRLLADEMIRLAGPDGTVVMPHLHSALGENFTAGMPLTPAAYANLFGLQQPRLFSDERLFSDLVAGGVVDLTRDLSAGALGTEASLTLIASRRSELFRRYTVPDRLDVAGELRVNPLYRIERHGQSSVLTLTFPTPEYEEEFAACKQYLPETITMVTDLAGPIDPTAVGADYREWRRRRVLLDLPADFL